MRRILILHDRFIYLAWVVAVFVRIIILEGAKMNELAVLKSEVVEAICSGIRKADREYGQWTGDEGLGEAPEYLMTCAIARELAKLGDGRFVTLEASVQETLRCARVRFRGRPRRSMRKNGRADIVLWEVPEVGQNGVPRSIIEVKNFLAEPGGQLNKDVSRLRDALCLSMESHGELGFGCLAFWIGVNEPKRKQYESPEAWLRAKSEKLCEAASGLVATDGLVVRLAQPKSYLGRYEDGTRYAWAPSVLVIERPSA
ncbi:hypothetical protein [Chromobacterium vaccinii]|uniref:Uncharacterized protein n=1 Tax=Chromobacterium vaccinii TaxID=1108595 RepID=A0A1D9LED8_9NEIS|nr:hypothetical protein [Chromobacterium vaccinii]AOZ49637.1 hypothetical protein BKX93_06240 [Chromobacterium vaccinii]